MDIYKLIVNIEVFSFFNETQEYVFMRDTLNRIDEKTYMFSDAQAFFDFNKKYIYSSIAYAFEDAHGYTPTDIALGDGGIYLLKKDNSHIRSLFKKIDFKGNQIALEDILMYRMISGNLIILYQCDQERKRMGNYESLFAGLPGGFIDKLENDTCTNSDIKIIWDWIKKCNRRYSVIRYLLTNTEKYDYFTMLDKFYEMIPSHESRRGGKGTSERGIEYTYRPPYNDD